MGWTGLTVPGQDLCSFARVAATPPRGVMMPGCLFQLQLSGFHNDFYFVAVAMKKPRFHVLLQGHECSSGAVSILDPTSQQPILLTSHQLFHKLVSAAEPDEQHPVQIPFVIHTYAVRPLQPLQFVHLEAVTPELNFSDHPLKKSGGNTSKTTLPFGFKCPQKPRRQKQKKPAAAGSQNLHVPDLMGTRGDSLAGSSLEPRSANPVTHGESPSFEGESPMSGSSSSSSTSSSSSSGSESECFEQLVRTPAAAQEERETVKVLESHERLMQARDEAAGAASSGSKLFAVAKAAPIVCNTVIGLVEVGTQVAARLARCRSCGKHIQRGQVRFGYSYHRQKFHCWLHSECAFPYMKQEAADVQQALTFLEKTKSGPISSEISAAICSLEAALRGSVG